MGISQPAPFCSNTAGSWRLEAPCLPHRPSESRSPLLARGRGLQRRELGETPGVPPVAKVFSPLDEESFSYMYFAHIYI